MHPLFVGTPEVLIVLVIAAIVIFGGSRLAGIGKGAGQAIREFKEETDGLNKPKPDAAIPAQPGMPGYPVEAQQQQVIVPPQPPAPQQAYPQQPYAQQGYATGQQPYGGASVAQPAPQPGLGAPVEQQAQQQPYQTQPPAASDAGLMNPGRPADPQA